MQSLHRSSCLGLRHRAPACRIVHVQCSFSFANSERANKPTGRRNRHVDKQREDELRGIAQGLCNFNGKQLQAVSHLLTEAHLKEIRIGMDIPPTNQGRRRQAGLVMKLLRSDLDDSTLSKLAEAVQQASRYNLPYSDSNVEQQLDIWMEGLVANEQDVAEELFELLSARQQDWQQIRTWVRQIQQHEQQRQEQQEQQGQAEQQQQQQTVQQVQGAPAVQLNSVSAVGAQDPEVLLLIQEELNAPQQQAQLSSSSSSSKSKGKSSKNPAAAARRSIRRMLKPLALDRL